MNVYMVMPTANLARANIAIQRWKAHGYKVAVYVEDILPEGADAYTQGDEYRGYWSAVNQLVRNKHVDADVFVAAADDMDPDPNHTAQEIGKQFLERFPDGFGIMQPCGDPSGPEPWDQYVVRCPEDAKAFDKPVDPVPAAARICGSPWFGRGWVERAYQGGGPMPARYFHFYGDEELRAVAQRLGVLWLRPDLTQTHHHWTFPTGAGKPELYQERNSKDHWAKDQATYEARKAAGFPGHEPRGAKT